MSENCIDLPQPSVLLGEPPFRDYCASPKIEDFSTSGGVYREAYDNAAARLGTTDDKRIVAELYREHWSNTATPQDAAQGLIEATTVDGLFSSPEVNTERMAAEIVAMRRTDPEQAAKVEAEIARRLPDAGTQSRLYEDIRSITEDIGQANDRLQTLGPAEAAPTATVTDPAQLSETVDRLLADASVHMPGYRTQPSSSYLDVSELAYRVEVLAAEDPQLAQVLRSELTGRMSPADAATFNRFVAGEKTYGEKAWSAAESAADFSVNVVTGAASAAYDATTGTVIFVGHTVQYGADNIPILGPAGDYLRESVGEMPGWADAILPSDTRGSETSESIVQTATSIKDYTYSRYENPSLIISDANGIVNNVKESHAEAVAQGSQAEWWGNLTGRAAFEVGTILLPASKISSIGRIDNIGTVSINRADELTAAAPTHADGVVPPLAAQADDAVFSASVQTGVVDAVPVTQADELVAIAPTHADGVVPPLAAQADDAVFSASVQTGVVDTVLVTQADELIAIAPTHADGVVPPVSRQTDEVIAPILAREFSVIDDNFSTGNKIILVDGQYWNIPAGKSVADLPLDDLVGDKLQALTTESAARWGDSPWDMLSTNEIAAALRNSDVNGLATRLIQQAKGRWVEALVQGVMNNEISNSPQNLIWSRKGLDITDLSTGIKYDIMSGTRQNLRTHALREPDQIFRILSF